MKSQSVAFFLLVLSCNGFADLRASNRSTGSGHSFNSAVLIKAGKIRNETSFAPGFPTVSIQDCTGHRLIQLNDRAQTYMITELSRSNPQVATTPDSPAGSITLNINEKDTGERKQLLGYNARHIKGTIAAKGASGACSGTFQATTDGWYIDLPEVEGCTSPAHEMLGSEMRRGGCNDRILLKSTGVEQLGYPVLLDTIMDEEGRNITVHQETTALSSATLDPNLFQIPAGYTQVQSYQDLMGLGKVGNAVAAESGEQSTGTKVPPVAKGSGDAASSSVDKKKKVLRIGVTPITSIVDQSLATDGWQQELANDINFLGGQAVILSADPGDREASLEQGKEQGCDYVVFTNVTNFKSVGVGERIGSVLGRGGLGGVGGSGQGRVGIAVEVKVFQPDNYAPVLDGTDDFKQNDADATAKGLMKVEARDVMLNLKRLQSTK